ncbi:MAG TPA: twin-arginine translocation signal domain-containing protein, partial [Candidatus Limnocylindrales bacterium]
MAEHDLDEILQRMTRSRVNRRGFLAGTGLAGLSAFIAACTQGSSAAPSSAPSTAPSTAPSEEPSVEPSVAPSAVAVTETEGTLLMY